MSDDSEEKICLFCLEAKRGRRQHLPIEFRELFVCKCIFQSHGECMMKWHIHCPDDLQCPICRVKLIVSENERRHEALQELNENGLKKVMYYFFVYILSVFVVYFVFILLKV